MKESIVFSFDIDGNQYMCHLEDFVDLQSSPAGFGFSKKEALMDLLEQLGDELC
jgi:hypothetical protein